MDNREMIHWWQGYVVVKVRGEKLERLINRMMYQRLAAWDIVRTSEADAQLSITVKDFFKLRPLLKETGCRVKVVEKLGLPFMLRRMGRRLSFTIGAFSFCLLLYLLSMLVWTVEIEGVSMPEKEALFREELAKMGVKPGRFKFLVDDPQTIQRNMIEAIPDVTWVGFQFQGTKAILKVVEKTKPEMMEPLSPRNLIAKKKAVVHDLFVEQGEPKVKPNQYVRPGDILVSGIIGTEEHQRIVPAKGRVLGEVWYESNISVPLVRTKNVFTGETKDEYYVHIGNLPIKVWGFEKPEFDQYEREDKLVKAEIKNWTLPFAWNKVTLKATEEIKTSLTEQEAAELALEMSRKALLRNLEPDAEIKEENVLRKRVEHGKVYMKIHYTVIEDIAKEQLIWQGE